MQIATSLIDKNSIFILNYHVLFQFINIFDIVLHISLYFGKRGENLTQVFMFFGTKSCYSFLIAKTWRKKWKQKNKKSKF